MPILRAAALRLLREIEDPTELANACKTVLDGGESFIDEVRDMRANAIRAMRTDRSMTTAEIRAETALSKSYIKKTCQGSEPTSVGSANGNGVI